MGDPEIKFIGDLARVDVQPGDKFVLTSPTSLSDEQVGFLTSVVWEKFAGPGVPLLILQPGFKLGAFGPVKE